MALVVVTLDRGILDRAVHPLDLPVRPWATRLRQAVLDFGLLAGPLERVPTVEARPVLRGPVGGRLGLNLLVHGLVVGELKPLSVSTVWILYGTAATS